MVYGHSSGNCEILVSLDLLGCSTKVPVKIWGHLSKVVFKN